MVSQTVARNIIGIIGNVISFGLFISPVPTFWTIHKRKDVEQFSPNPYMATVLNCAMWVLYGCVKPNSTLVITINGFGLFIEFVYIAIYMIYANSNQKRSYVFQVLAGEAVFMGAVIGITLGVFHAPTNKELFVGILCVIFNVCMYAMPLDVMLLVIKTKSVEYLPFFLSLTNCVNGCIWFSYAQMPFDLFMTISNGSGAVLGAIQLLLYAIYYKSTPSRDDKNKAPEVQLSNNV